MKKITTKETVDAIVDSVSNSLDPALIDGEVTASATTVTPEDTTQFQDLIDTIVTKVRDTGKVIDKNTGHSILSKEAYEGFSPDIQVTPKPTGFSSASMADQQGQVNDPLKGIAKNPGQPVRTANDIDLSKLDESMIMSLPFLSLPDFKTIDSLNLKPKDPAIRFRWVNYKNFIAGNMGRYVALGFEPATVDDINVKETPVDNSMIEGSTVKYYDIQLFKIHVLKLMALYKMNIILSLGRIRNFQETGQAVAEKAFNDAIQGDSKLLSGLHKMQAANNGESPIEFYKP